MSLLAFAPNFQPPTMALDNVLPHSMRPKAAYSGIVAKNDLASGIQHEHGIVDKI